MQREERNLRDVLLKLLCKGDTLKCVFDNVSGGTREKPRNVVAIVKVRERTRNKYGTKLIHTENGFVYNEDMVHVYNGELYYSWICSSSRIVVPIIERVVNSPDTIWDKRY